MIGFRLNCFHELEIIPTGFKWKNLWYILKKWNINQNDINLFSKVVESMHTKEIILPKNKLNGEKMENCEQEIIIGSTTTYCLLKKDHDGECMYANTLPKQSD